MKITPEYLPWLEFGVVLTIVSLAIFAFARIAERWSPRATWRRTVWQVASLGLFAMLMIELTGVGKVAASWLRSANGMAADASTPTVPDKGLAASKDRLRNTWRKLPACGSCSSQAGSLRHVECDDNCLADPNSIGAEPARLTFEDDDGDLFSSSLPTFEILPASPTSGRSWLISDSLGASSTGTWRDEAKNAWSQPAPADDEPLVAGLPATTATADPPNPPVASGPAVWPAILWILGSALLGSYVIGGHGLAFVFHWRASRITDTALQQRVRRLAGRLGIRKELRVVESPRLTTPAAFGLWRPTIALPLDFTEDFGEDEQNAILVHELAHLAASDPVWHLAVNLLAALLWWQPIAWLLRRRLHFSSEIAADEATLIVPAGPEHLAAGLVAMGRRLIERPRLGWLPIIGDGYRSNLGRRVTRLLNLEAAHWRRPRRALAGWLKTSLVLVLVLTMVLGSAWVRPQTALAEGESTMTKFRVSWSRSLAAAAVAVVFSPLAGPAQADDAQLAAPPETLVVVAQEREEGHQPVVVVREEEQRREGEARREADGDQPEREVRREGDREREAAERPEANREQAERREREAAERREQGERERGEAERREREVAEQREREMREREGMPQRERVIQELEGRRAELMERAEHLKRELADVPEGGAPDMRHALEETMQAIHRTAEELERARHPEQPRPEGEGRERMEQAFQAMMREREELMEVGRDLQRQLEELKREGKEDAAHEVAQKLEGLKREFAELEARGKEMHARLAGPQQPGREGPPREEIERRMQHLRAAAENLHAAGMHEQAEQLMQQAERLARGEMAPPREQPRPREMPPRNPAEGPVQDLQRQVNEMRGQMEEMHRALRMLLERQER